MNKKRLARSLILGGALFLITSIYTYISSIYGYLNVLWLIIPQMAVIFAFVTTKKDVMQNNACIRAIMFFYGLYYILSSVYYYLINKDIVDFLISGIYLFFDCFGLMIVSELFAFIFKRFVSKSGIKNDSLFKSVFCSFLFSILLICLFFINARLFGALQDKFTISAVIAIVLCNAFAIACYCAILFKSKLKKTVFCFFCNSILTHLILFVVFDVIALWRVQSTSQCLIRLGVWFYALAIPVITLIRCIKNIIKRQEPIANGEAKVIAWDAGN